MPVPPLSSAVLVLDPLETRSLLQRDGLARLSRALDARARANAHPPLARLSVLVRVPFVTAEAFDFIARIVRAQTCEERLALQPSADDWVKRELEPVFRAGGFAMPRARPAPATLSAGFWERFLIDGVHAFLAGLASRLGAERFIHEPACLRFMPGRQEFVWSDVSRVGRPDRAQVMLVAANVLTHGYPRPEDASPREPLHTLLPPDDLTVIRLALATDPTATLLRLGPGGELPPHLERLLPPGMPVEALDLSAVRLTVPQVRP